MQNEYPALGQGKYPDTLWPAHKNSTCAAGA